MLCLPSVDALRELRLKGISPDAASLKLRPKGIRVVVMSPEVLML